MASVLIVDDDPVVRRMLQLSFESEGFDVLTAGDGLEGLESMRSSKPNVVVLDIMMPKLDGLKVMRELQGDDSLRGTPVILLSAKATSLDIELGLKAGAADYVTKPCDPIELVERVRSLLAKTG
ncbi:MAG: response regulator [Acidimicrobiia bacterium]|nr:response regulator [Acidimicrobiia bacterium]MBV9041685.1 response regulator [Acidimicrobiia bacterium]MBV9283303.1 response regulator [Acidimicrobiia bacterium]